MLAWAGGKSGPSRNRRIARVLLRVAYPFLGREVRKARRTLAQADCRLAVNDGDGFLRRVFENFGKGALDVAYMLARGAQAFDELVDAGGLRRLEDAIRRLQARWGRGVCFSAHLGNWELLAAAIARVAPFAAVARRLDYPEYQALVEEMRERLGVRVFYQEAPLRGMLRFLEDGGILGLLPDQDIRHTAGVFVPFFGRPAYSPVGPALLAATAKAPLLPVFMPHNEAGYSVLLGEPMPPPADREPQTLERVTAACQQAIEQVILAYPEQWAWFHPRYRTRPEDVA